MKSTFKIIFYLKKRALKPDEDAATIKFPIMGRITVNGEQVAISTKLLLQPALWDTSSNRAAGRSDTAKDVNRILNNINSKVTEIYHDLCATEQHVTAKRVKQLYEGFSNEYPTFLEAFRQHVEMYASLAGKKIAKKTYRGVVNAYNIVQNYMHDKLGIRDIDFLALTPEFMEGLITYMRDDMHYSTEYQKKTIKKCRRMAHDAVDKGILSKDPFDGFYIKVINKERIPLEEREIKQLINIKLNNAPARAARDMFLFMIFTGLPYCDLKKLTYDRLVTLDNGDMWIIDHRKKNNARFQIKLLPPAKELVERYRNYPKKEEQAVFPVKSYDGMYQTVRRIGIRAGISKPLSLHMARHTFATTIALNEGVPIDTVSKALGHSRIETTLIYAKIQRYKINRDMDAISDKIEEKFSLTQPNERKVKTA